MYGNPKLFLLKLNDYITSMSLFPIIGFTALSDWWFIKSAIGIKFFRDITYKNKFTFEESSKADFYLCPF